HRGGLAVGTGDQRGRNRVDVAPWDVVGRGQGIQRIAATALAAAERQQVFADERRQGMHCSGVEQRGQRRQGFFLRQRDERGAGGLVVPGGGMAGGVQAAHVQGAAQRPFVDFGRAEQLV